MAENQNQTSSQDLQSQRGAQNQPTASSARSGSGSVMRRSFDPLFANPWEFFSANPFSLMRRMNEEMDRFFNQTAGGWRRGEQGGFWSPAIEVAERDGKYVVHAELPGLKPEEVKVELRDNTLVIQGERRSEHEETRGDIHRSERRYGQFYREIPLPEGVNPEQVNARFENGMLEITAPVPQSRSNSRQIPIQSAGGQTTGTTQGGEAQSKSAQSQNTQSGGAQRNRAA